MSQVSPSYAIGIDLGTTYSCVAVFRNNGVEIIANELGERTTPSYVAFTEGGTVVGKAAKNLLNTENQGNVVFDVKRLIGREFNDPTVQNDMKYWPFKVVEKGGKPYIQVQWHGETVEKSPQEISAIVLMKLKQIAEDYLGCPVKDAVITVPAYFSDNQRHCTKEAGQLAGLNVLRVLSEPTAAAIAYGLGQCPNVDEEESHAVINRYLESAEASGTLAAVASGTLAAVAAAGVTRENDERPVADSSNGGSGGGVEGEGVGGIEGEGVGGDEDVHRDRVAEAQAEKAANERGTGALVLDESEKQILVFDLGGGTFDVSLLSMEGGFFQVKATAGDTHLGGGDIDNILLQYLLNAFLRQHKGQIEHIPSAQTPTGQRMLRRLRAAAESAKLALSTSVYTVVEVDSLWEGKALKVGLSRARFESMCAAEFNKCMSPLKQILADCKVEISRIREIVLVGGSTRIPKIREMLEKFFGKSPNTSINPDEAVAYGAAVQAAIMSKDRPSTSGGTQQDTLSQLLLVDVTPLSLGVETAGHHMSTFIKRNTSIPVSVTKTFSTDRDNQTAVDICVYEGERADVRDNIFLGKVSLEGIPVAPAGVPRIQVTFALDQDGILNVTALEESSNTHCAIRITNDKGVGRLTPEQIQALLSKAEQYKMQDNLAKLKHKARARLLVLCTQVREAVKHLEAYLTEKQQLKVLKELDYTETWLNNEGQFAAVTATDTATASVEYSAAQLMKEYKALDKRVNGILSKAYTAFVAAGNTPPPATERSRNSNSNANEHNTSHTYSHTNNSGSGSSASAH